MPPAAPRQRLDRAAVAWALYDWGNSAFATTVMAAFFPLFFAEYWCIGLRAEQTSFRLGAANSLASLLAAVLAPVLGAIADRAMARKRLLLLFAALGVVMTGGLWLVAAGQWLLALCLYVLASVGFAGSLTFYDALLLAVAHPRDMDLVSALGYACGYLGGGLLFALNAAMVLRPAAFGLADSSAAVRWAFLSVAVWWALFSLPLLLWVREPAARPAGGAGGAVRDGLRELRATLRRLLRLRDLRLFLIAYWLYIDGVDTVIRMAVDYGHALGFGAIDLLLALGITQVVGFPAAIAYGRLGQRFGARRALLAGIVAYAALTAWGSTMDTVAEFYALAAVVGLVQGGVQSLSRSLYARLIPPDQAAQFFGLYNMLGKSAAIVGPTLMAWIGMLAGNPRWGILSILLLFAGGGVLLARVRTPSPA